MELIRVAGGWLDDASKSCIRKSLPHRDIFSLDRKPTEREEVTARLGDASDLLPAHLMYFGIEHSLSLSKSAVNSILARIRYEAIKIDQQALPRSVDFGRPVWAENVAHGSGNDTEKLSEQFRRCAIGIVRLNLALNHSEVTALLAGKIQYRVDRQREHRTFHQIAALTPEHRLGLGMLAEQAAIDEGRQVLASLRGQLKTLMNEIGQTDIPRVIPRRLAVLISKKKEQGHSPALKIVSTLFSPNVRFIVV